MRELSRQAAAAFRDWLPKGRTLSREAWAGRHRAILVVLWLHVVALAVVGAATGHGLGHSMAEAGVVAACAFGASLRRVRAEAREVVATLGLVISSAILVHFSDGLIEMHFHFFVMVAVVTLYQSWTPFLLAVGFVVLHHGTVGILDSSAVYNHPEAVADPWTWALIHGLFIAGASAAGLTAWKLNEVAIEGERHARRQLEDANRDLAAAQAMAHVGSWDWDITADDVWWSDELYRIFGVDKGGPVRLGTFLDLVHPDDRLWVEETVGDAVATGGEFAYEARIVRPDGTTRLIEARGAALAGARVAGTVQDVTDRKSLEDKIQHQAFHDSLTGLANRDLFIDRVGHALSRQARVPSALAVLFLDLDDFKAVNDSLGHRAGDELLVHVARRIDDATRPGDTVARLGGDELAILLEDLDGVDDAVFVADRVTELFESVFVVDGSELSVHASIGVAFCSPDDARSPDDLLRDADIAMYEAKRGGKATFQLFESGMRVAATDRLRLKADLQQAVDNGELELHYQPIVRLVDGHVTSVEALVRWRHPARGLVPPLDFIPFAEESGLIVPIGRWVLLEACRTAAAWEGDAPPSVSVNVSPLRFRHPGFVEELTEALTATGLPPERLVLEITESALVEDVGKVVERLDELKRLGVQLAIDDFGTGYSSLSYLKDFAVDILKIDKAFIDSIALGAEDSALARAVLKLGQSLNLKIVAEGVEEGVQADVLRTLGCPLAQGYLFSRPVPADALAELLEGAVGAAAAA
ncbi:MAG: GGDEF and EAL domain-containing protein [Actinomycetota bacterium]|nr:GGDEF and EAL domain-containing protein [Actinomycetota bacterium]